MIQRLNHINEICEELGKKNFFGKNVYFEQYKRNCVFVTNSNFLCLRLYWNKIGTIVLAGWVDPLLVEYAHQQQETNILQFN